MRLFVSALLLLFLQQNMSAQCTSCTYTATTSGGSFSLNGNETLCITANVSNLNINMNGSGNIICVASGVTWIQDFLTLQGGVTVNVYGTIDNSQQSWSSISVNGGTACTIDIKAGGTMQTIAGGFGNNLTINNSGILNFTATGNISHAGSFILNNAASGVVNAMSTPKFEIGNNVTVHNYGTLNLANCENAEGYLYVHDGSFLKVSREFNNHGAFIIEPTGDFQLPCETLSGAAGATVCSFRVGDKGAGKEFISNACVKVMNGNVTFDGAGTLNAGFEIGTGYNLTINKPVTGTNGSFLVKGGTSTINISGNFIGTNMKFYDVNTAGNDFDSKFGNDPTNYTVSSSAGCNVVPTCTIPTITGVSADTATCNAGVANNDAAVHVTGITGMAKYAYGTNGTTGLFAATAIASTAASINITGLANPASATTYTFRIYATDSTCYNDTTIVLNHSVCVVATTVDLALVKTVNNTTTIQGSNVVFTIKVKNDGTGGATGVTVHDSLPVGMTFISATPSGVYDANTKLWTIGTIAAGDSVTIAMTVRIDSVGVNYNTAEVHALNETDTDSSPNNGVTTEDDIDRVCVSVPVPLCTAQGKTLALTIPSGYTNIKWFKDNVEIVGQTSNTLTVSAIGSYTFTADESTCPVEGCCPVMVVEGNCDPVCKPIICLPVTVTRAN